MENVLELLYRGFCIVLFCMALSLLFMINNSMNKAVDSLDSIVTNNSVIR